MQKHLAAASGPTLHRSVIAVAMAAIEDDAVQEALRSVRPEQQKVFMMVYECIVMWAMLRGLDAGGLPEEIQEEVVTAMRNHFADHSFYMMHEFEKIWDSTQQWMPEFAKPSKDGNLWPAAGLVQIPGAAGCRLDFVPDYTFGCHLLEMLESMADIGKFAAHEELAHQNPWPGTAPDPARQVGDDFVVRFYRHLGAYNNCPPTARTSDGKIIEIYSWVRTAFQEAALQRGERIPAEFVNRIVSGFLQIYEKSGESFMREHLHYEIENYLREGLRADYRRPLSFFGAEPSEAAAAQVNRGKTLTERREYQEAIACFDKALALEPQNGRAWFGKGEALFHLGREKEAKPCFDKAMGIDPQCAAEWASECIARAQRKNR
jgi:hypothetical protein